MNEQEFAELAAGHALNALSAEDFRAYSTALLEHPEWNYIVAQDAATAATLARGVAQVSPPLGGRGALMSLIARTPQQSLRPESSGAHPVPAAPELLAPLHDPSPGEDASDRTGVGAAAEPAAPAVVNPPTDVIQTVARRSWMRGMFALAASLALLVTLGFGAALIGQQIGRSPAVVALDRIEGAPDARSAGVAVDDGGAATAHWSESLGEAVLVTDGLSSLATGQTYQLWLIRDGGTIESAGLFTTPRDGEATLLLDGEVQAGDTIAVSVEPAGGSEQPTTEPIVAIPTAA